MLIKNKIEIEIDKLDDQLNKLRDEKRKIEKNIENILNDIKNKKQLNENIKNKNFITDHALIRFLERKKGIDIKKIKEEILTPKVIQALLTGAQSYKENGFEYIFKQGKIITIIDLEKM